MPALATLRFGPPEDAVPPEERSFFVIPVAKELTNVKVGLNEARNAPELLQGAEGLDAQGFTYIKHHSAICDGSRVLNDRNLEDIYFPELEKLICKITGAKKAVVLNAGVRSGLPTNQEDAKYMPMKGSALDQSVSKLPQDVPIVVGRTTALEPNRKVHIDYTIQGIRDTARYMRYQVKDAAQEVLDAEDAGQEVPRYAVFSMWRPLKTVKRDPLVVCDWRTLDKEDIVEVHYRHPSEICGEFLVSACSILPPKETSKQKWYYAADQTPDDVLILKVGDTQAATDPSIAAGCAHVSPAVDGTEDQLPRESIETRVMAFW